MTEPRILEPTILDAIERYFELLQGHASAQEMTERVLTDDFETGFVAAICGAGRMAWPLSSPTGRCSSTNPTRSCN